MPPHVSATRINTLLGKELPELPGLPDGISVWTAASLDDLRRSATAGPTKSTAAEAFQKALFLTIDILGVRSQRAQEIAEPLTSVSRLHESNTYKLYLLTYEHRGMGLLKVGVKKLFLTHPRTRQLVEVDPLCVLDFFVDESSQRKGFGKQLFVEMLAQEGIPGAEQLAIDRPSTKFLHFLKKHYNLAEVAPQVNNFVVFTRFFDHTTVSERGKLMRPQQQAGPSPGQAKNGSPGAVSDGNRAPGGFTNRMPPNLPSHHYQPGSGEGLVNDSRARYGAAERGNTGSVAALAALGQVAPYQPPPPSFHPQQQQQRYASPAARSGSPQSDATPRLVPYSVHNTGANGGGNYQNRNHRRIYGPSQGLPLSGGGGSEEGRLANEQHQFQRYNPQAASPNHHQQHRLSGGNGFPRASSGTGEDSDGQHGRSPSPGQRRQPPRGYQDGGRRPGNNFYNGYGDDMVISLSPERTPERRRPAEPPAAPADAAEARTPSYGKSRVAYNIITGQMQ